jgi:hypothetical protein
MNDGDPQHVTNRRTPSPGATARVPPDRTEPRLEAGPTEGPLPTSDVDAVEVTLGAYGDRPLEVRAGVVTPSPHYIVIDGGDGYCQPSYDRYEAAQAASGDGTASTEQSLTCEP